MAGTHGKTTTSSLLAHVLKEAETYPSYAVGGIIKNYGLNAELGTGPYFVAEADESDGTHIKYHPFALIVTNIDQDHMEHYGTEEKLIEAFKALIYKVSDYAYLFTCGDDPILKSLSLPGEKYGFDEGNSVRILSYRQCGLEQLFTLDANGKVYSDIFIPLIGRHNILNAAAVFALALKLNVPEKAIRYAFSTFRGVDRRADFRWEKKWVRMYDDYAHHPEEVKTTIDAFKEAYPQRRLVVVFQPHRYTRLKDNIDGFSSVLKADLVIITDVYAASENPIDGVTGENLAKKTEKAIYIPRKGLANELSQLIRPFDIILSMGAGDITHLSEELSHFNIRNLQLGL
ncbi:MAG: UDP-N-acetylmuramate--L-alanine ligase, partial [Parachlamydiaceae bacterium]